MNHGGGTPCHALIFAGGTVLWAALLALAASGSDIRDTVAPVIAAMPPAGFIGAACILCCRE